MVPHCQDRTQWYTTPKLANNSSTNFFLSHIDNSYRMNTSNTSKCGVEIVSQWFLLPEFPVWVSCYHNIPGIQVESTWDVNLPLDMILHLKELCSFISKKIYYWRQDYKSISLRAIANISIWTIWGLESYLQSLSSVQSEQIKTSTEWTFLVLHRRTSALSTDRRI